MAVTAENSVFTQVGYCKRMEDVQRFSAEVRELLSNAHQKFYV
jgi:hypothetical protein